VAKPPKPKSLKPIKGAPARKNKDCASRASHLGHQWSIKGDTTVYLCSGYEQMVDDLTVTRDNHLN
jgi:hypothetical protein